MTPRKFRLRKWAANIEKAIEAVPNGDRMIDVAKNLAKDDTNEVKVLGLYWNRETGELYYHVEQFKMSENITKREALAIVALRSMILLKYSLRR